MCRMQTNGISSQCIREVKIYYKGSPCRTGNDIQATLIWHGSRLKGCQPINEVCILQDMKNMIVGIGCDAMKTCANSVQNHLCSVQAAHFFTLSITYCHLLALLKC